MDPAAETNLLIALGALVVLAIFCLAEGLGRGGRDR